MNLSVSFMRFRKTKKTKMDPLMTLLEIGIVHVEEIDIKKLTKLRKR